MLLTLSFSKEYFAFLQLKNQGLHKARAVVSSVYEKTSKNNKSYLIYKLKTDHFSLYTVSWKMRKIAVHTPVIVEFSAEKISFYEYMHGFFANNTQLKMLEETPQDPLRTFVKNQHESIVMQELFGALFFAEPTSKTLKIKINQWGISHLVAISGFHLGLLSVLLFFVLKPVYVYFQDRYFPYRHASADLAFIVLLLLGAFVYYIGAIPSVLRAFSMSVLGFIIISSHVKIFSLTNLFLSASIVLIFVPQMLFSIGFLFSIMGVFYIFLFFEHFKKLAKWQIFLLINVWVYILMLPVVHAVFEMFTFFQPFSIVLSMLFTVFYPLSMLAHLFGIGGVIDGYLYAFLNMPMEIFSLHVSAYGLIFYLCCSLFAIRYKSAALLLPLISLALLFVENVA
ncbi:MAG: ComEC/Rec2 family competence protein [Sulfurospirillum sp.]|nr:ComEC/Rec2 family competence protein [Sulfurospirillum sp.]